MALTSESEFFCLVCNTSVDLNSCTNIFYVSLPHNGEILANFIVKILRLSTTDLCSSYVCLRCYNLFFMLEQAQWTATNIQCEILKVFQTSTSGTIAINNDIGNPLGIAEFAENILETERINQIVESKLEIQEPLIEKNTTSLINIASQIPTNIINESNEVNIKYKDTFVISNNEEFKLSNFNTLKQRLKTIESCKTEPVIISHNNSIFSDNVTKATEVEDQKSFDWQNDEECNLNSEVTINENPQNSQVNVEAPINNQELGETTEISKNNEKSLKFTCDICGKQWRTSTELKTHVKTHSNIRPFMCEKCGQSYKHKHALEIHVSMHNGESPFRCTHCNKCFTQKGALQRHLRMHTGETPYECEQCGKKFVHHTSYHMHVLSHTGKKSHKCYICDLSLLSTSHLKRHMRIHTGEKPYSCDYCGKSFAERYNLLAHQKIHDPLQISAKELKKNQYKCEKCEARFAKCQKYEEHLEEHRAEEASSEASTDDANLLETCVNEVWQSMTVGAAGSDS